MASRNSSGSPAASKDVEHLHLSLLGPAHVSLGGRGIEFRLAKSVALLAYLATEGPRVPRSVLATLLWSEMDEAKANNNLRVALAELRSKLPGHLEADRISVWLTDGAPRSVDLEEVGNPWAPLRAGIASGPGPVEIEFMAGFHVTGAPVFEEWLARTSDSIALRVASEANGGLATGYGYVGPAMREPGGPIFGRDVELLRLATLLHPRAGAVRCRLVTLSGLGGVGKTRLAHEFALYCDRQDDWFAVAMVELAGVDAAEHVAAAISRELRVPLAGTRPTLEELAAAIGERPCLVVLDNLEHLLPEAASIVAELHGWCPSVAIVVTSREPLGIEAEKVIVVRPFSPPQTQPGSDGVASSPGVAMFLERASFHGAERGLDDVDAVARLVTETEGFPLAIELAAARSSVLSPREMLESLSPWRVRQAGSVARGGIRSVISESFSSAHNSLSGPAASTLGNLSVFRSGAGMDQLARVCECDIETLADHCRELVHVGLVHCNDAGADLPGVAGGRSRFNLLETTRTLALGMLKESEELDAVQRRHAMSFAELASRVEGGLRGPTQLDWLQIIDIESDNIRAALGFFAGTGEAEHALGMANSMYWYWMLRGLWAEAEDWLHKCLGSSPTSLVELSKAHLALADLAARRGSLSTSRMHLDIAEGGFATLGDAAGFATATVVAGLNGLHEGRSLDPSRRDDLIARHHSAIATFTDRNDAWGEARTRFSLSHIAFTGGDAVAALSEVQRAGEIFSELGDDRSAAMCRTQIGIITAIDGDMVGGRDLIASAFPILRRAGDVFQSYTALTALACFTAGTDEPLAAARLFGALSVLGDRTGLTVSDAYTEIVAGFEDGARSSLSTAVWEAAFEEGRCAGLDVEIGMEA